MIFFYPKVIETRNSKINGEIQVTKLFGTYRLIIGNCTQSGGLIEPIWKKALKVSKKKFSLRNPKVLILGLGAGTAAKLVTDIWKNSKVIGIELDPAVIDLAKKYFKLNEIQNLKVIKADAIKWVYRKAKDKSKTKFDLILVDMYIGSKPSAKTSSQSFFLSLEKLISNKGVILFNRLIIKNRKNQIEHFQLILSKSFPSVARIPTPANVIFAASKQ